MRRPGSSRASVAGAALLLASVAACGGGGGAAPDGGGGGGVRFSTQIFPAVRAACALSGCHDEATTINHFTDFTAADKTYNRWLGPGFDFCPEPAPGDIFVMRTIVVPGDPRPEASYLVEKLTSTREDLCRDGHHPRMPPSPMPALTPEQIGLVTTWIAEGAADD